MKTWLNKYYLNERQNLIFVIIILYNIIFCLLYENKPIHTDICYDTDNFRVCGIF